MFRAQRSQAWQSDTLLEICPAVNSAIFIMKENTSISSRLNKNRFLNTSTCSPPGFSAGLMARWGSSRRLPSP